ncbi:MAG: diguanylate cyclase [Bacteroidales bacterium]|nr:diguanylate cyclase [Bacteroidales bacterium]
MKDNFYKQLIEESPTGYAYHRIICDKDGNPCDYEVLEINASGEALTGIKSSELVSRNITEILPEIGQDEFDWIKHYGEIAIHGGRAEFEHYSEALKKWYKVIVYSPKKYYFVTHFVDVSNEKEQIMDMQWLVQASKTLLNIDDTGVDYAGVADDFLRICKAKYAVFNLYDEDGQGFTTKAISGNKGAVEKAASIFGYPLIGKKWGHDSVRAEKIKQNTVTRFSSLKELVGDVIPKPLIALIEKMFLLGEVVLIKITNDNVMLGDFTLMMPSGVSFSKDSVAEIYTKQLGIAIERERAINKQKIMEKQLYLEKEWLKTTLLSIGDGVIAFDNQGKVLLMNKTAEELTGYKQEEATGKPADMVFNIVDEYTKKRMESPVSKVLESGDMSTLGNDTLLISRTKVEWPIEADAFPIRDQNNNIIGVVLVFREITEQRKKQKEIEYLSFHDSVTGLYNRRFFEEELKRLNTKRNLPLTLVMFDVNGLKLTNDAFGHKAGDELLRKVAEGLKEGCRADDIIARIGGDEFAVILPKTDSEEAGIMAKRISARISRGKVNSLPLSVSFGWDTKKEPEQDIEAVFKNAEDYLYRRKLTESTSMRSNIIELIMQTLFEKSDGKEEHAKRVSGWCASIGSALALDQGSISDLSTVGLMHDIGDIAIDARILNKPDALTVAEWSEIKRHPEIGFRILSSVNELAPLAEIILANHERWDGTGYPKGLKGEEIPLKARILAVADAYDAMTSERPYRKAMSKDAAVEEIRRNAGTQFDPMIAELFIEKVLGQA